MDLRVKMTAREIFLFSVYHFYRSIPGCVSIACTIMALGAMGVIWYSQPAFMRGVMVVVFILVVFGQPFALHRKAVRQAAHPQLSREIHFKMDYNGIRVQQGKDKGSLRWKQILKVGKVSDIYILYLNKDQAYLIPERVLDGGKKEQFLELVRQYVPAEKRRRI